MNRPEVTVIIPTHDRSALLAQTLQCVLGQREVKIEVLVVDDGSTDDTVKMVAGLRDPRITLIRNQHSQGLSAARNRGIDAATGYWISFLDDDDLWAPDKLACQVEAAQNTGRDWVYGGAVSINDSLDVISAGAPPSAEEVLKQLPFRNAVPAGGSNVIVRLEALRQAGRFDPNLRFMEDWDMWIRLGQISPPAVVNYPIVAYRRHTSNLSNNAGYISTISAAMKVIEDRYMTWRGGLPIDRAYWYRWIAWSCLGRGDRIGAMKAYVQAIATGDLTSVGRAVIGFAYPGVARRHLHRHPPDPLWKAQAEQWLKQLVC